ncbi:MAG: SLC13 family permease [Treponemataceae bacterium]
MNSKLIVFITACALAVLGIAALGYHLLALGWVLIASMILLSLADDGKPSTKTFVTSILGATGFFVYVSKFGIPASPHGDIIENLREIAHAMHLEIFVFLAGLYLVVNTFSYSGFIGDLAWKIVKKAEGKLGTIIVAIMILTCLLSGIFDGATITTIMGIITLTILLSSGMRPEDIVKILLLLVVATNIGGVWFVLGEPTNILAAEKLKLSPFFFVKYASLFALPAAGLCAIASWLIVRKYPKIRSDRPEMEILLEGVSLRRAHAGTGTLADTLEAIGTVEVRSLAEMARIVEDEGLPDFEAALKAGIPRHIVHEALSVNLNSEELAQGLIDYYHYRSEENPMADLLIGDMLKHVHDEYKARTRSRNLILASGGLLITLLIAHAFIPSFPTWASTVIAGLLAVTAVQPGARRYILEQTKHNMTEAFFLIAIFVTISELNFAGAFDYLGKILLNLGSPAITGAGILTGSALLSAVADNVAVMDVLTNLISGHPDWSFFALAAIVGTSLGGFASPIASVQAVIMATIIRRVARISFGRWVLYTIVYFILLLIISIAMLFAMRTLGLPPANGV